jgi:uncharacterized membrane protein YjjB (DUF3815 family)
MLDSFTPFFFAALGGSCFAVVYKIPIRYFLHATVIAMIARLSVDMISSKTHVAFATFVATFIVASISHLFARFTGKPAQTFLIPGIIYLVPGTSLYSVFSTAMAKDFAATNRFVGDTILSTVSISFAVLLANWIVPSRRTL